MTAPAIMNSPVLAEPGCPPGPVSQPASSDVGPPSRSGVANSQGFDSSRAYFPVARRPRATRPPADALSMAETVAVIVGAA